MVLCRECDRLLLRVPAACPSCAAWRPGAQVRSGGRSQRLWLLAPAVSAPVLVAGDTAARWLLAAG